MEPKVNTLHWVRSTTEEGVVQAFVNVTDFMGETYDSEYIVRPDAQIGLAPIIRKWLEDNKDKYVLLPPTEFAVTKEDVRLELNRRLALGFVYNFGDWRGQHRIGTSEADMARWVNEVTPLAQAAINLGQVQAQITIATETGVVPITAIEWQQILMAAAAHRQPLYATYFTLKEEPIIPSDYASDKYWPH